MPQNHIVVHIIITSVDKHNGNEFLLIVMLNLFFAGIMLLGHYMYFSMTSFLLVEMRKGK